MSMRSDHKALLFLAAIAALGATVRVARAIGAPAPGGTAALDHQMKASDSAKRSLGAKRQDKARRSAKKTSRAERVASVASPSASAPRSEHRDYKGRLDLDLASAAEIDSLPGVGPALAKRIVADRMKNGAFRELTAMRRVKGVSPKLMSALDSLVGFSGVYKPPLATDTILPAKSRKKQR